MTSVFVDYKSDSDYGGAGEVVQAELQYLSERRGLINDSDTDPSSRSAASAEVAQDIHALAISGGGIRSASFALGVLQAFSYKGWLKGFDYISTVSGGGYIGSSIIWLMHKRWQDKQGQELSPFGVGEDNFPYRTYPHSMKRGGRADNRHNRAMLRRLRQNINYLKPGHGLDGPVLLAVLLRTNFLSLLIYLSMFTLVFLLLTSLGLFAPLQQTWLKPLADYFPDFINSALFISATALGLFLCLAILYALMTFIRKRSPPNSKRARNNYHWRRKYEIISGKWYSFILLFALLGAIPLVDSYIADAANSAVGQPGTFSLSGVKTGSETIKLSGNILLATSETGTNKASSANYFAAILSTLLGVLSGAGAFIKTTQEKTGRLPLGLLVVSGTTLLMFGVLLLAYLVAKAWLDYQDTLGLLPWLGITAGASIAMGLLGLLTNINYVSIHRFYRDRLMEAFMPSVPDTINVAGNNPGTCADADSARLYNMRPRPKANSTDSNTNKAEEWPPYHIINTNVVLTKSLIPKFQARGNDNFILSPDYCGSNATGWHRTDKFMNGNMTLATAMAISGAAVTPNAGGCDNAITRKRMVSLLLGLLNIRLGYWLPNPARKQSTATPNFWLPGLWDLIFRSRLSEKSRLLQLSDGGHFENLGLYELVRRRATLIVVTDASADAEYFFSDLANAIEKVRVDFNALIDISSDDLQVLIPREDPASKGDPKAQRFAKKGYLVADILYLDNNTQGKLIYIKTTMTRQQSADIFSYRKNHPEFPHESTGDQFFDEKQFEAYRELGYQLTWNMMEENLGLAPGNHAD